MFSMISSMVDTGSLCFLLVDDVFPLSFLFSHVFLLDDIILPLFSHVFPMFLPIFYCLSWFATCGGEVLSAFLLFNIVFHCFPPCPHVVLHCFPLFSPVWYCLPLFSSLCSSCWCSCPPWYLIRIAMILLTVWSCPVKHVCLSIFLLYLMIWWSLFISF